MNESSKSLPLRNKDFELYLKGIGLDIGAGHDILKIPHGSVDYWDLPQGDAQYLKGAKDNNYDFVYSSHCLEHMVSVEESLKNWVRVLKPGGFLFIVVPDFKLYEKLNWPSYYNGDHKFSFSLDKTKDDAERDNHYHINDLKELLKDSCSLIEFKLEDLDYDYSQIDNIYLDQTLGKALAQIKIVFKKNE